MQFDRIYRGPWLVVFAFCFSFLTGMAVIYISPRFHQGTPTERNISSEDDLYSGVQRVFNGRCIACHSCYDSPCQLNLQSYEGLARGVNKHDALESSRKESTLPTRLFEDASSPEEWHAKLGFHDVIGTAQSSVLLNAISVPQMGTPKLSVDDSRACISQDEKPTANLNNTQLAMPFGMAPISQEDAQSVRRWVEAGAPKPKREITLDASTLDQVGRWTDFLNDIDPRSKLVSRYLYEHLFIAHLYFDGQPKKILRLIRSSQTCDHPKIIATKHANDYPGDGTFYYCLVPEKNVIVNKTHIPYMLSDQKLAWLKQNFFAGTWQAGPLPSYKNEIATNPFETFKDIPLEARYKFLLEDSFFHVSTFIKGPVCSGTGAVNAIQEQFYVFFMEPKSDLMVQSPSFAESVRKNIVLPGKFGSEIKAWNLVNSWNEYYEQRKAYRSVQMSEIKRLHPGGYGLQDIWDGSGTNDNAVLTVLRHSDNATVVKGPKGDLPKTVFVLDFLTFERLCYDLVVNYNAFGNVGHQLLTRLYMDTIRMDSEDNFLNLLPPEQRNLTKHEWYKGNILTKVKLDVYHAFSFPDIGGGMGVKNSPGAKDEVIRKILFERLNQKVRGPDDVMNWKIAKRVLPTDSIEKSLSEIGGVRVSALPFAKFFPGLSLLLVGEAEPKVYSLVHNEEVTNIVWVAVGGERVPAEDRMVIGRGLYGSYPNLIFAVHPEGVQRFVEDVKKVRSEDDFKHFREIYAVKRLDPKIWTMFDYIYKDTEKFAPDIMGYVDLSKYAY